MKMTRNQLLISAAALVLLVCLIVLPRVLISPEDTRTAHAPAVTATVEPSERPAEPVDIEATNLRTESSPTATPPSVSAFIEIESDTVMKSKRITLRHRRIAAGKKVNTYEAAAPIAMGGPDSYSEIPGVTTFRGNNYRDNSAYGLVPVGASKLSIEWSVAVGGLDDWNGVGWTGQAAIVEWPEAVRQQMNIKESKKEKSGLKEVIIAALDGKIRFLDLDDGMATRSAISIGAPIKGSVTVDPRGYPLLYCGQGIFEVHGKTVKCGTRIFNLLNQKTIFFLNGNDKFRTRNWYCFDAAPLIDGTTDTMLQIGENGLVYRVALNTDYDVVNGKLTIDPVVDRYGYKSNVTSRPGMENSISVYNHYGYFADNSGLLQCLDLNTLQPKWAVTTGDDTDATTAIEQDDSGVWLYTANEIDLRGNSGDIQMRKYDALTGKEQWKVEARVSNLELAGSFASPAIGKNELSELVYFHIAKTTKGGTLFAINKETGKTKWALGLGTYGWSTPALVYDKNGCGYVLIGSSSGKLRLVDGLEGETITSIELKTNIESSPAVFDDMAIVSTRGGKIYGIRIS